MAAEPGDFPTSWKRALTAAAVVTLGLVALRWGQLRSVEALLYHGEFTGLGRRIVDVHLGGEPRSVWDFRAFWDRYQYQTYAQGTVYTQVVGAWFAYLLGPSTKALHATSVFAEAAAVFAVVAAAFRTLGLRWGLPVAAAMLGLPILAIGWQLAPYGNHTEFQVFPLLLGAFLAATTLEKRAEWARWLLPVACIALGLVAYRGNGPPFIAFVTVVLWGTSRTRWIRGGLTALSGVGAAYWILAYGIGAGLTGIGPEASGAETIPSIVLEGAERNTTRQAIETIVYESLPAAPRWVGGGVPARALLALGWLLAAFSWLPSREEPSPGRLFARYASLWTFGTLAAVVLGRTTFPRYLVGAYYALLMCWMGVLLMARPVALKALAATALSVIALGGFVEARWWMVPSVWAQTEKLNGIPLWFDMNVNYIDLDELPYYQRVLDEERDSEWVGFASHHVPLDCLVQGALVAQTNYLPRPSFDACHGFDPETGAFIASEAERELDMRPGVDRVAALKDVGVGLWIRCDRDMGLVASALAETAEPTRGVLFAGALAEAARYE